MQNDAPNEAVSSLPPSVVSRPALSSVTNHNKLAKQLIERTLLQYSKPRALRETIEIDDDSNTKSRALRETIEIKDSSDTDLLEMKNDAD